MKSGDAPERFAEVVARYHELYETVRREKPTFGSRQGSAIKQLMKAKGGADGAIAHIERVFAPSSWWKDKATIVAIAADPDKYVSATGTNAKPVQRSAEGDFEAHMQRNADRRAREGTAE